MTSNIFAYIPVKFISDIFFSLNIKKIAIHEYLDLNVWIIQIRIDILYRSQCSLQFFVIFSNLSIIVITSKFFIIFLIHFIFISLYSSKNLIFKITKLRINILILIMIIFVYKENFLSALIFPKLKINNWFLK